jgi:hypothetical protein
LGVSRAGALLLLDRICGADGGCSEVCLLLHQRIREIAEGLADCLSAGRGRNACADYFVPAPAWIASQSETCRADQS